MPVTVLIVDDSRTARHVIGYHLRNAGCKIVGEAESAMDALAMVRELKPDLVTLDLMMPVKGDIDSKALVRIIKKEAPATRVIIVSVIPYDAVQREFKDEGVFAYVVKPFNEFAMRTIKLKLKRAFPELAGIK